MLINPTRSRSNMFNMFWNRLLHSPHLLPHEVPLCHASRGSQDTSFHGFGGNPVIGVRKRFAKEKVVKIKIKLVSRMSPVSLGRQDI
jgi:hypothetical protein